jgi:uncharacterized membrane-anchored protein
MSQKAGIFAGLFLAMLLGGALAQNGTMEDREAAARQLVEKLRFQSGEIPLGNHLATLRLPESLQYLDPQDTRTVLADLWGNPPEQSSGTLGMLVPKNADLLSESSWAVVITYDEDGHVKDDDAGKINYTDLLKQMQESTRQASAERQKEGYEAIELVGWAAPPKYDQAGKKLYWAKELAFGAASEHTLNYNIRILGRQGVLVLNAVAARKDLPLIEAATPDLLAAVSFDKGNRYEDFDKSTDKLATYGLAALVAGGVAAKVGLFKGLWLGILAFKKFIIAGVIGLVALVKRFFSRRAA